MPRDLADVLHYFMPELAPDDDPHIGVAHTRARALDELDPADAYERSSASLALAAVPIANHDIVRASLLTGLASEIIALGGDATILTPATSNADVLFAQSLEESPRLRIVTRPAGDLASLHCAAVDLAAARADDGAESGVVLVRIPPHWLRGAEQSPELLEWLLLFASPEQRNLSETYALAAAVLAENPKASVGITVYGAEGARDGAEAFALLAHSVEQRLGLTLTSYGTLVEDLDIYRAIVAGRALGRAHPNSLAAKALRETAKLVYERAKKSVQR